MRLRTLWSFIFRLRFERRAKTKPSNQKEKKLKNPKFLPIEFAPQEAKFTNLQLVPDVAELLYINRFCLFDDFFGLCEETKIEKTLELIQQTAPAFWAIVEPASGELAGIAFLYDWIGNTQYCHSTKVSTCFARKYWGKFAQRAGKLFLRYVFAKYRPARVCAEVYSSNAYPKAILQNLGFTQEFLKPSATVVNNKVEAVLGFKIDNPPPPALSSSLRLVA